MVFSGVRITHSLILCVCIVDRCLSFFFWPLCCLSFVLRILITPLISSNSTLDIEWLTYRRMYGETKLTHYDIWLAVIKKKMLFFNWIKKVIDLMSDDCFKCQVINYSAVVRTCKILMRWWSCLFYTRSRTCKILMRWWSCLFCTRSRTCKILMRWWSCLFCIRSRTCKILMRWWSCLFYIRSRTCKILMRWWSCLFCTRSTHLYIQMFFSLTQYLPS